MSSVGLSSSDLSSLLGSTSSSSSNGIDLSSIIQAATGSTSEGINVTAAVNALVTAARAPEVLWQAQEAAIQSQETDITKITTETKTLQTDLSSLDNAFSSLLPVSSNSSVATATATMAAVAGTHVVNVTRLATADSWYSGPVGSSGFSAGTFELKVGANGTAMRVSTTAGESLDTLANYINSQSSDVTASVVTDTNGSRLSIVSNNTGSANNITITNATPQITLADDGQTWSSASVADPTGGNLLAESLSLQVGGGKAVQISITDGESLNALASSINDQSLGVTASVVQDSNGSTSHLEITNSPGSSGAITISDTPPQFTESATPGQNAELTVDGIPVSSASNTVAGVVTGISLNLTGSGSTTLSLAADVGAITAVLNQFVTDYNTLIAAVNSEYTYNAITSTAQPLAGDSTLGLLQNALLGAGSYASSGGGSMSTLGLLGIAMNDDGTLTVNSSTLSNALQSNFPAVTQFFEGNSLNGFTKALNTQLQKLTAPGDGAFTVELRSMQTSYNGLQDDVTNFENNYIAILRKNLTAEYSAAEIALQNVNTMKEQINAMLGNNSTSGS